MILVTGATGLTGGALVRRLSATGIPVRALVRSAARADRLSALPTVEIVEGDMAHPPRPDDSRATSHQLR